MNRDFTIASSQTVTGAGQTADQLNLMHLGAAFFVNVSAISGTGATLTPILEGKDPVSGSYFTILTGPAITAAGISVLQAFPGMIAVANQIANSILPRQFRIRWTLAGTTPSATFSIGSCFVGGDE